MRKIRTFCKRLPMPCKRKKCSKRHLVRHFACMCKTKADTSGKAGVWHVLLTQNREEDDEYAFTVADEVGNEKVNKYWRNST